jgi:hypothetical protein
MQRAAVPSDYLSRATASALRPHAVSPDELASATMPTRTFGAISWPVVIVSSHHPTQDHPLCHHTVLRARPH